MSHRALSLAALAGCAAAAVAAVGGCQDYNYNPVGSCLIQPGQLQTTLEGVTTADVLFVVDDSGSMDSKQQALADNFQVFIDDLDQASRERVQRGLEPFDFHIAVTTSSIFRNYSGSGYSTSFESSFSGCTQGLAVPGAPYPQGSFVAFGSNPTVLHFTKSLYQPTPNTAAINALVAQFKQNIKVGSCGSGQEQHLQAGRLAMQKALAGQYGGEFPHLKARLVIVWVADEDDCSNPADPAQAIVLTGNPGNDSCVQAKNDPNDQKLFRIADFNAFFSSLVAPPGEAPSAQHPYSSLGAAFIVAANRCTDGKTCAPADAQFVQSPASCTGTPQNACSVAFAAGKRHLQLADAFILGKREVIEGTVCEPFGPLLKGIADLVKPPSTLTLSSQPAANQVTVVRVVDSAGKERKVCAQAPPASTATAGWWFIDDCSDKRTPPPVASGPTACIYINHDSGNCEANPGDTYSAEYLGVLPAGGCPSPNTAQGALFCAKALVNPNATAVDALAWTCYPTGTAGVGTCLCNSGAAP